MMEMQDEARKEMDDLIYSNDEDDTPDIQKILTDKFTWLMIFLLLDIVLFYLYSNPMSPVSLLVLELVFLYNLKD